LQRLKGRMRRADYRAGDLAQGLSTSLVLVELCIEIADKLHFAAFVRALRPEEARPTNRCCGNYFREKHVIERSDKEWADREPLEGLESTYWGAVNNAIEGN
jgi:hypothetical protein